MMPSTVTPWMLAVCLGIFSSSASTEIYRWTDSNGKVHFSDKANTGNNNAKNITKQLTPINSDSSKTEVDKLGDLFQEETSTEKSLQQQKNKQLAQQKAKQKRACENARTRLKKLQGPVAFFDKDGNEVLVTEEERGLREKRLKQHLRRHCPKD